MKTTLFKMTLIVCLLSVVSCGNDDIWGGDSVSGEPQTEWNGEGTPEWLPDELFKIAVENYCGLSSFDYFNNLITYVYKFDYKGKPCLAIDYKTDAGNLSNAPKQVAWGLNLMTNDGRRMSSVAAKMAFNAESKLIMSHDLVQNVPTEIQLPNGESISWMSKIIEDAYKKYGDTKILEHISVNHDSKNNLLVLCELYMTSTECVSTARFFTVDGTELTSQNQEGTYKVLDYIETYIAQRRLWKNHEYKTIVY